MHRNGGAALRRASDRAIAPDSSGWAALSRRAMLFGGALIAGTGAKTARAGATPRTALGALLDRTTYGPIEAERILAQQLGYAAYLDAQLNPASIDDTPLTGRLAHLTTLSMAPHQLALLPPLQVIAELLEAVFLRAVYSRRQLFERVVEFWHDHFNVSIASGAVLKAVEDRDVIRPNALGRFSDLLLATARSPAMIEYLDNNLNDVNGPNENYARELMELHTIGVGGGYTQQDVGEVARCFTGWSFFHAYGQPVESRLTFVFRSDMHDHGQKVVLGNVIPANGGINDGYMVLNILAQHPATARRIAGKLAAWFWGANPPAALVDAATATFVATGGDIKAIIRTILGDFDLTSAPLKFKRPFHVFMSGLRQTGAEVASTSPLRSFLSQAGHLPFNWAPPNGYPDHFDAWSKLLITRWNFLTMYCAADALLGLTLNSAVFFAGATTPEQVVARIDQALFDGQMPAAERQPIMNYASTGYFGLDDERKRMTLALALSSPAFQWY